MIRALVVDDEAPARAKLRRLLAAAEDVTVVAETADGEEAVAALRAYSPDLVFLDVQMPRRDGFEVVAAIGVEAMPVTVFVTAYDEHAVRAFEVHALDYLLKPFAARRFEAVLARVRVRLAEKPQAPAADAPGLGERVARMERLLAEMGGGAPAAGPYAERILGRKSPEREVFVAADEIDRVRAEGNYLRLFTARGELRLRETLAGLAARLGPERFLRINRSELVRFGAIREVQPWFHGDARVILEDGTLLSWSRRYRTKGER